MSAFEFFFSFYGLVLGLSVAVIATGVATTIQHRNSIRIGRLTPLLAIFVALDIASFWENAWDHFGDLPFSYGMLVAGLVIALIYFVAASLVFPQQIEPGTSLDDHFWANKKFVLLLIIAANLVALFITTLTTFDRPAVLLDKVVGTFLYTGLTLPAAFARRGRLAVVMLSCIIGLYVLLAISSSLTARSMNNTEASDARPEAVAAAAEGAAPAATAPATAADAGQAPAG